MVPAALARYGHPLLVAHVVQRSLQTLGWSRQVIISPGSPGYSADTGSPSRSWRVGGRRVERGVQLGASELDGSREVEVDEQAYGRPEAAVRDAEVGEVRQVYGETDRGDGPRAHGEGRAQPHVSHGHRDGRTVTVDERERHP